MQKNTFLLFFFSLCLIALVSIMGFFAFLVFDLLDFNQQHGPRLISVNGHELYVYLADSPLKRSAGLSQRDSLAPDHGLLFIFDDKSVPGFWMKDMRFPLDILWIEDNIIVDISANLPISPNNQNLKTYYPSQPVNYVLEVNAGWAAEHKVQIGDKIQY